MDDRGAREIPKNICLFLFAWNEIKNKFVKLKGPIPLVGQFKFRLRVDVNIFFSPCRVVTARWMEFSGFFSLPVHVQPHLFHSFRQKKPFTRSSVGKSCEFTTEKLRIHRRPFTAYARNFKVLTRFFYFANFPTDDGLFVTDCSGCSDWLWNV